MLGDDDDADRRWDRCRSHRARCMLGEGADADRRWDGCRSGGCDGCLACCSARCMLGDGADVALLLMRLPS